MDITAIDSLRIALDPPGQAGVAAALMLVMFGVALGLTIDDFRRIAKTPRLYAAGVVAQIIGLPLLTLVLVHVLQPPPSVALGMFVVACCPGGAVSNLLSYLGRADVALSVALTATSSVLAAVLTPASILIWSGTYGPTSALLASLDVSPLLFIAQTTALLAIPLIAGMFIAARSPDVAAQLRRHMSTFGALVLAATIVYGLWYFMPMIGTVLLPLVGIAVVHNAMAFALGAVTGLTLVAGSPARRALTFELGIQNSGLALVILVGQLQGLGGAAAIAAIWGVWHLLAGAVIVIALRTIDRLRTNA